MYFLILFVFFFFQAEDGIRDLTVTGVQTCALPICAGPVAVADGRGAGRGTTPARRAPAPAEVLRRRRDLSHQPRMTGLLRALALLRSEERRVGKECRSRWSRDD